MKDILCYNVDAESETGAEIAKLYPISGYPALFFLNPDGSIRDILGGFLPAEPFAGEVARVLRDEGTLSGLRARVAQQPHLLNVRYELALKLRAVGDEEGAAAEIAAIRSRDPEGKSEASQRIALEVLLETFDQRNPDPVPLEALLAKATVPEVLFQGHNLLAAVYGFQTRTATEAELPALRTKEIASYRALWENCPEDLRARASLAVAFSLWERREWLTDDDKDFAWGVASSAVELNPENATAFDTLACCQFLKGMREAALATLERAVALDPDNEAWADRRKLFSGEG